MCCAWTAVDKMSLANGCLAVEPGSHKLGTLEHDFPKWEVSLIYTLIFPIDSLLSLFQF